MSDGDTNPRVIWRGHLLNGWGDRPDTFGRIVARWLVTGGGCHILRMETEVLVTNAMGEESWAPAASYACPKEEREAMDGVFLWSLVRDLDRHRATLPVEAPLPSADPRGR